MKTKRPAKVKPILIGDFDSVYDRIMYRGAIVPSCDSRRLLQSFVDRSGADDESIEWVYENVVAALMRRSDSDRRMLLSEMVATWLIHEYGPMAKEAKARE